MLLQVSTSAGHMPEALGTWISVEGKDHPFQTLIPTFSNDHIAKFLGFQTLKDTWGSIFPRKGKYFKPSTFYYFSLKYI